MTEERMEKIAEEKIHLALSRLNRINTFSERFSLFGQSTVNAIREKSSQAWFSVKRLFIKTAVLGSVPVPDLPETVDETNVDIPQKATDTAVIDAGFTYELSECQQDIVNRTSDAVVSEPISDTVKSHTVVFQEALMQKPLIPKPKSHTEEHVLENDADSNPEVSNTQKVSTMETVD